MKAALTSVPTLRPARGPSTLLSRPSPPAAAKRPPAIPAAVQQVLASPGEPLDAPTRALLEPRLSHALPASAPALTNAAPTAIGAPDDRAEREADALAARVIATAPRPAPAAPSADPAPSGFDFSRIRVHTDARAVESANAINALAFTAGNRVVFGRNQFAPSTPAGLRLLTHELAHVAQQGAGAPNIIRRKVTGAHCSGVRIVLPDTIVFEGNKGPLRATVKTSLTPFTEPHTIEYSVDEGQFVIKPGEKVVLLDVSLNDRPQSEIDLYIAYRDSLTPKPVDLAVVAGGSADAANPTLQQIDALPPQVRDFLFDKKATSTLDPADYATILRVASKIAALTPAELAEYKSRTTSQTTDWSTFEASVDRFLAERKEKEASNEDRKGLEVRLFGLDDLFDRYWAWQKQVAKAAEFRSTGTEQEKTANAARDQMRTALEADLIKAGMPGGIPEFEQLVVNYQKAFEKDTLALANLMLDQYAHLVWTQEAQYQQPGKADSVYAALQKAGAPADYQKADQIRSDHAQMPMTPSEMADQAYWVGQRNEALAQGQSKVLAATAGNPLVREADFPRENLGKAASKEAVQSVMLGYIADRKKNIADTRQNLADKPRLVYGLPELFEASRQAHHLEPGSLLDKIIQLRVRVVHQDEAIPQMILTLIALVAGLFSGGTGTVAVLAAGTALGIGAYQAVEEFKRYEMKSAAYGAKLTSDDPSMAWVIVAVIGAGFDAAGLASALVKAPELRVAIEAFNAGPEASDVASLTKKLESLSSVEEGIRKNIIRGAKAEVDARAAWKAALSAGGLRVIPSVTVLLAEHLGRLAYAVFLSAKRGIREFQVFVKTNEAVELIGDVTKMSAEDLAAFKTGYLQSIEEMKVIAAKGATLKMSEEEIGAFMKMRGETKGMTVEQLGQEMEAWRNTQGVAWKGFSKGKLADHFLKHGGEFPGLTQAQYLRAAKDFGSEVGNFQIQQVGNFLVKFDPATRRTLVAHIADREVRTFYIADLRDPDPFKAAVDLAKKLSTP